MGGNGRQTADELATRLLGGLRTELGGLQIAHARRVAAEVSDEDDRVVAAALLHDVLEKTPTTADELFDATGDARVVELVEVLTRRPGESDRDYLTRCAADPAAHRVKRVDLVDELVADDAVVSNPVADAVRRKATARLVLLDELWAASSPGAAGKLTLWLMN